MNTELIAAVCLTGGRRRPDSDRLESRRYICRTSLYLLLLMALAPVGWAQAPDVTAAVMAADRPSLALNDPLAGSSKAGETTLDDQTDVAVTVYNNNRALVRDRRTVKLLPGEVSLKFMGVAGGIMPETVSLKSLTAPGRLHVLEQNYEYDLMSPEKLMEKYVGRDVRLINHSNEVSFYEQKATLLSVTGGPVYQVENDIYLGHPGTVVLPEIPEELIAKPTLVWLLDNDGTDHEIEATYLTSGLSWRADYVLTLSKDDAQLDLEGWVTLNNQSQATYNNAQLKLVAGEVNVVQPMGGSYSGAVRGSMKMARAPEPMREESFAEYHLYTLPRRTTIKQNQGKQVRLLTAENAEVTKVFEYRGNVNFYSSPQPPREKDHVGVFLTFENEKENQLGMPLPAGVIRVYKRDNDGMLQFAGEDRIEHTPKDEEVKLRLGNAFDVIGERVQTDYTRLSNREHEAEFEITIRNHKEESVTVDVVEPMPGDWKMLKESQKHEKKDAHTAIFRLDVPKDGEESVRYRVRVRY